MKLSASTVLSQIKNELEEKNKKIHTLDNDILYLQKKLDTIK